MQLAVWISIRIIGIKTVTFFKILYANDLSVPGTPAAPPLHHRFETQKKPKFLSYKNLGNRGDRIRTYDLLVPNQAL